MRIAVLAATGATGRQLLTQALDRGHDVVALVRDPARLDVPSNPGLRVVSVDVHDPASVAAALVGVDAVVSGLGSTKRSRPGILTAGATALTGTPDGPSLRAVDPDAAATRVAAPYIVWLGACGSGVSAPRAGLATRLLLKVALGTEELADKAQAEDLLLAAGASVMHARPLTNGRLSPTHRTVALADAPRRLLPATISRATVAATMLDEAEHRHHPGAVTVPLS